MRTGIWYKNVTWDDAPHLNDQAKAALLASYPEHERATRSQGVPLLGSGAVYPVLDEDILCDPFELPKHFYRINGIDFGIDHPFAWVALAWDKDADTVYLYDSYRKSGETPVYHAVVMKKHGTWIPHAWPHDGMNRDKGSGRPLWKQYKGHGANMLPRSARYDEKIGGPQGTEPAVIELLERMRTGRFKVFRGQSAWFEEKRAYHRKDGIIVAKNDDLMKATQYALMDKRRAKVLVLAPPPRPKYSKPIIGGSR